MVFGDFDADGLTGLADPRPGAPAAGESRRCRTFPQPARRGPRPLHRGDRCRGREAGATVIATVDCGSTSGAGSPPPAPPGIDVLVTDHHRLPAGAAGGGRDRQPAAGRQPLPGSAARRQNSMGFKLGPAPARRTSPAESAGASCATSRDGESRDRADPRRAGDRPARAGPDGRRRPARGRRAAGGRRRAPEAVDVGEGLRSRSRRGSTPREGWGSRAAARLLIHRRSRDEADRTRRGGMEAANKTRRDLTSQGDEGGEGGDRFTGSAPAPGPQARLAELDEGDT